MSHENVSLRLSGDFKYFPKVNGVELAALGPLNANAMSINIASEVTKVPDKRHGRRGQNMQVYTDPVAPTGTLSLYSTPRQILALLFSGTENVIDAASGTATDENVSGLIADRWTELAHSGASTPALVSGVRATAATGVDSSDNAITWTAKEYGTGGNAITVAMVDPGATASLGVSVTGSAITVNLAYATGAITSTAAQVMAAIEADASASALVTVADTGASDGTGVVASVTATSLSGGANTGGTTYALNTDFNFDPLDSTIRPIEGSALDGKPNAFASYSYAVNATIAIHGNTVSTVRGRLVGNLLNESNNTTKKFEAFSVVMTPNGEFPLVSDDPVTADFSLEFETPTGYDHPFRFID